MTARVPIKPKMITWAVERSGRSRDELRSLSNLEAWEKGEIAPTYNQLQNFAKKTYVPIGYLFLSEPPDEPLPIPDLRVLPENRGKSPSLNLRDTLYICEGRQHWYREYALEYELGALTFVGSCTPETPVSQAAKEINDLLGFDDGVRKQSRNSGELLLLLSRRAEAAGILVMRSGKVGTNTRRKLDPKEFRGFALADEAAPLIFINSADARSAQLFTFFHELAHIWLGASGISDAGATGASHTVERWCNAVAGECLVPTTELAGDLRERGGDAQNLFRELAHKYRVSTQVLLIRLRDVGEITQSTFSHLYASEQENKESTPRKMGGGGNFYNSLAAQVGPRFAQALLRSTYSGETSFKEAMSLLALKSPKGLDGLRNLLEGE